VKINHLPDHEVKLKEEEASLNKQELSFLENARQLRLDVAEKEKTEGENGQSQGTSRGCPFE
jgi:hypothetical protein